MNQDVTRLLKHRLVVCVGSGGVGKTTTAAALGVAAAQRGHATAVITFDPALRLKDALGLSELSAQPQRVPLPGLDAPLDALALDTKHTFDALIERVAPSTEIAQRIFANRLYQEVSNGLGGSAEYMAMEKLHELLHLGTYDLVIVDTPPGAHARDLLGAPLRLTQLLASSAAKVFKAPASILGLSHTGITRTAVRLGFKTLERWISVEVLKELASFVADFEHLIEGFRSRAEDIKRELRHRSASFILVTSPEADTVAATIEFHRELKDARFPVGGVVVNRVHHFAPLPEGAGAAYPAALRHKLNANYADFTALSHRDAAALAQLRKKTGLPVIAVLPALEVPPASLHGLISFARELTSRLPDSRHQLSAADSSSSGS
jgi:anion-transporting  ArsA/GET3 family ATPase